MSKEAKDAKERHAPHDIATRVQALTLKVNGFSDKEILEQTGVASRTIRHIYSRARKRGFDPDVSKKIELKHIEDGKRTGRPRKDATATPKKPDAQLAEDEQQEPPQGPPSASLEGQQPLPQLSPPHEQPDQQPQQLQRQQQQQHQQQHQLQQQPKYAPPPQPQHSPLYVQHQLMSFAAPSEHETGEPPQDVDMQEADLASRLREELTQPDSIPMDPAVVGDSAGRNEAMNSSFNPPSIAHLALATSAVTRPVIRDPNPHRILLLFSTHNADKAPTPASFEHRLAMMTLFAEDLSASISNTPSAFQSRHDVAIDIGLTKKPYYTDKSIAITTSEPNPYPSNPTHVHLIGYDTVTRFLAAKYYPDHSPPLSALAPYFDPGHKILATLRPSDPNDSSSKEFGSTEEQIAYIEGLSDGSLAKDGFKPEWARQVDHLVSQEGIGVSSTRIRKAAKAHDWAELQQLCTPGVAAWVENQRLYQEDAKGAKMA
ncbi:hypothetical protein SLS55_002350 [Diplodia seriata]|uniref:Uncharacterized protein n=1 Tax=Diplodia seriata TaxID=420778 RepID=A0ABR3CT21_9PEZI